MSYTRREFGKVLAAAPLALARVPQQAPRAAGAAGVIFGLETFSFHDLPSSGDPKLIPTIISNMRLTSGYAPDGSAGAHHGRSSSTWLKTKLVGNG